MELEKFTRQLRLIELLTQNRTQSIEAVGKTLRMSRRTIYRYLDAMRNMGFIIRKEGTKYRIDPSSPFFIEISSRIHFSEEEALTISQVLNSVYSNSVQVRRLREKLAFLYGTDVLAKHGVDNHLAQNISTIFQAISEERVALLKNYHSPSSGTVTDRIVEPYMFLNENSEVRCFEISSKTNKTFKLQRAESVELVDLLWSHKAEYAEFHRDLFGFTGEEMKPVSLLLGELSTNLLLEEYIDAQRQLSPLPDGRHRFDTEVCSYVGIGRFVMGLLDDIEIVDSPEFKAYIRQRIRSAAQRESIAQTSGD